MRYICNVCGFNNLDEKPYDKEGRGSFDICPCCGFQFGVDDDDKGYTFESYRKYWLENGAIWFQPDEKPTNWQLDVQLKNLT